MTFCISVPEISKFKSRAKRCQTIGCREGGGREEMVGGSAVSKLAKALLPKSGKIFAAMHGAYLQRKGTQA